MTNTPPKKPRTRRTTARSAKSLRLQDPFLERERARYPTPLPSREWILEVLEQQLHPISAHELAQLLGILAEESRFFARRLEAMQRTGQLTLDKKGLLSASKEEDCLTGTVSAHSAGYGFLIREDCEKPDLYLSEKEMNRILDGDTVQVRKGAMDFDRMRQEAFVVQVLNRKRTKIVGCLKNTPRGLMVQPQDKRLSRPILIPPSDAALVAKVGQIVVVELTNAPTPDALLLGRIIEVLGAENESGIEIEIALRNHDLPHEFSEAALAQAKKTPKKVRQKDWITPEGLERVDVRMLPFVTIDGETARDFDDAVYARPEGKGYRLWVAIADVSTYVQPQDGLDGDALERGTSVYFPRRVIPMLPEALSNGICSLKPQVERLCMVCEMRISRKGKIKTYQFYPAVMESRARLTYTQVAGYLEGTLAAPTDHAALLPQLKDLEGVFNALLKAREKRGAIDFETIEAQFFFDDEGKIEKIEPVVRNDAHRIIEECMLAANVSAAAFLGQAQHPALYRVHEGPTPEKLALLKTLLNSCGLFLEGGDQPTAQHYATLLASIQDRPDVDFLQTALLRSLQQAVYQPENKGHFGLSYEAYTHFTSPIRRYPDLLVHRAIRAVLAGQPYVPSPNWAELGVHCSMTERRADEASRAVMNWLKCNFMAQHVGDTFDGVISAVTGFGLFVQLNAFFIEGLVHISELGEDYFQYDQAHQCLLGERTGVRYRLGDAMKVKVVRVDQENSRIELLPAGSRPARSGGRRTRKPSR